MKLTATLLLLLLVIAWVVIPAHAVTYSEEYYTLENQSEEQYNSYLTIHSSIALATSIYGVQSGVHYIVLETHRQAILLEKQNELLEEQNTLLGKIIDANDWNKKLPVNYEQKKAIVGNFANATSMIRGE